MIDFSVAKKASIALKKATTKEKNEAITSLSAILRANADKIVAANEIDVERARAAGVSDVMIDRLSLSKKRIDSIADDALKVASLPDPVGEVAEKFTAENGLVIKKVRVPFGVIGAIYESRPNVTVDIAVLCIKTGNACILKGGKDAEQTNKVIAELINEALKNYSFSGAVTLLGTDRELVNELITARGNVDLVFPRGGKGLIDYVVKNATVPVIETGAGVCHVYVESTADPDIARKVLVNAKVSRPSVCNAAETLLIDEKIAGELLPKLASALKERGVTLRGDSEVSKYIEVEELTDMGYFKEYNSLDISVRIVKGLNEAISHINEYGTHHSEAIITRDNKKAEKFCNEVDSACCYVNASTRFTDGGCFGFGAELGISTQKMHARGPMGLKEMTSYHYVIEGNGQVR